MMYEMHLLSWLGLYGRVQEPLWSREREKKNAFNSGVYVYKRFDFVNPHTQRAVQNVLCKEFMRLRVLRTAKNEFKSHKDSLMYCDNLGRKFTVSQCIVMYEGGFVLFLSII